MAEFKLTPSLARKLWAEALRSGKYEQTTTVLRDDVGFCCLGVACDLFIQAEGQGAWQGEGDVFPDGSPCSSYVFALPPKKGDRLARRYTQELPDTVQEWLGVRDCIGTYLDSRSNNITSLASKNDNDHATFAKIASIIESEPKGLFTNG